MKRDLIKPCPFCGGRAEWYMDGDAHYVACDGWNEKTDEECMVLPRTIAYMNKEFAVKAWNGRNNEA